MKGVDERVRQLFAAAMERAPEERESFLQDACGGDAALFDEVRAFVEAADSATGAGFFQDPTMADDPAVEHIGRPATVGRYKLLELVGEGGFGDVYMAEQKEPIKRRVALKIIKLGMDTRQVVARFEAERQALAMMDHPNIARVLDGGATEAGRPYFVMELVRGDPITDYCDREHLATRERLELFIQVCQAVQHAHQKGIIHRDIKPSNILITLHDGVPVPKVIDFGIAKATNAELTEKTLFTRHRQMIGTPAYMSPEQAEMSGLDIDTRSDIYSLGVLLYELLTGTTPFDSETLSSAGFVEMMRIIREEEPHRPSTRVATLGESASRIASQRHADPSKLRTLLQGDLDWIVMRCLEKDRRRRYETANGLASDIRRHMAHEPVTAGPPGARYRLGKFMKRHRVGVLAGALVTAALLIGVVGTAVGMIRALHEKSRADAAANQASLAEQDAEQRAAELQKVAEFQESQLAEIDVAKMGIDLRRGTFAEARRSMERLGFAPPEVDERLALLAELLARANFTNLALETLEKNVFDGALSAIDSRFADQPLVRARLLQTLAETLLKLGLFEEALGPQEESLATRRKQLGDDHPDTLSSIYNMGNLLKQQGRLSDAALYAHEALDGRRRVLGNDHPDTLRSVHLVGSLLRRRDKLSEAEPYYREELEGRRRVLGNDHPDTLHSLNDMGVLLKHQGKLTESELYLREALERERRVWGNEHTHTLITINNMGTLLGDQGRLANAEPYFREAVEGLRRVQGDEHPHTLSPISNLGDLLRRRGKLAEADALLADGVSTARTGLGDHPRTARLEYRHANVLAELGRVEEAIELAETAAARYKAHPDWPVAEASEAMSVLGDVLLAAGRAAEAVEVADEYLERLRASPGTARAPLASALARFVSAGLWVGDSRYLEKMQRAARQSLQIRREIYPDDHPRVWLRHEAASLLGATLRRRAVDIARSNHDDAITALREAESLLVASAEWMLSDPRMPTVAQLDGHDHARDAAERVIRLHDAWHEIEPGARHDTAAAGWQQRLAEHENDTVAARNDR